MHNGEPPVRPALEIIVNNGGAGTSVVSRVQLEVRHVYALPLCYTQGDFPLSERYGATLSVDAEPGDVVDVPVHQRLAPGEPDRFKIELGVAGEEGKGELPGYYLFDLDASLVHDGASRSLPMGHALVSLPGLPFKPVYYLAEGDFRDVDETYNASGKSPRVVWAGPFKCWRRNAEALKMAGSTDAARSPELQESIEIADPPTFAELSD